MTYIVSPDAVSWAGSVGFPAARAMGERTISFAGSVRSEAVRAASFGEPSSKLIDLTIPSDDDYPDEEEDELARRGRAEIDQGQVIDLAEFKRTLGRG